MSIKTLLLLAITAYVLERTWVQHSLLLLPPMYLTGPVVLCGETVIESCRLR